MNSNYTHVLRYQKLGHVLGELETLSLLIACLCHDLDHRGGTQILSHLSPEEYMNIVHVLEEAILATDLNLYYKRKFIFSQMASKGNYNWKQEGDRKLLREMLMTACDIAAITKPWGNTKKGDVEKQLKLEPIDIMNRDKKDKLPLMQVAFIDSICLPVYEAFAIISDKLGPLLEGVKKTEHSG
ncbi:dual 3',5'-cyclic-AMP and -GMP phosphodiesterase 11 [Caerostris extrusa]|uniref:Dual 3',5'-cyclic-AMP and -GMP phosphodiesterase 11 n=1 Tax=Caerostris extrusa TaxID=172846 RepID=A0AAV4MXL0_CAEEX|nr:dual 3',5'-cyclic-AMP and -GMP phosphodiesterase 11 [Caerostris extrusa]